MEAFDLDVRRHVYFSVVANGRPPTAEETAGAFGRGVAELEECYRRLHDAHALVLFPDTTEIWMANPFCFGPTVHRVDAGGGRWTGTCAWDALGIPAALHGAGHIDSECACCREPVARCETVCSRRVQTCSLTSSSRPAAGGTTSGSPEARSSSSGRRST